MKKKKISFKILENSDKNISDQLSEHFSLTAREKDKMFRKSMEKYNVSKDENRTDKEQLIHVDHYGKRNYFKYSAAAVLIMACSAGLVFGSKIYTEDHNNRDKVPADYVTLTETATAAQTEVTAGTKGTTVIITQKRTETRKETSVYHITAGTQETSAQTSASVSDASVSQSTDISSVTPPVSTQPQEVHEGDQTVHTVPDQTLPPEETTKSEPPVTTVSKTEITAENSIQHDPPEPVYNGNSPAVFSVTNASVKPGETFFIDIIGERNAYLSAFQAELSIDDELFTLESVSLGSDTEKTNGENNLLGVGSEKKSFQFLSATGLNIDMNGKAVFHIELKAAPDAAEGRYTITLSNPEGAVSVSPDGGYQKMANAHCNPGVITVTGS